MNIYDNKDSLKDVNKGSDIVDRGTDIAASKLRDKLTDKYAGNLKKKAVKVVEDFFDADIKLLINGALKGIGTTFGGVFIILLILLCVIPLCLFSVQYIFNKESEPIKDKVSQAIEYAYDQAKYDSAILSNINSRYGCKIDASGVTYNSDGSISFKSESCDITVNFTPSIDIIAPSVSAYASAVNGTLAYYNEDASKISSGAITDENGKVIGYDINELPDINDNSNYIEFKEIDENGLPIYEFSDTLIEYSENTLSNDLTNASTDEFADNIRRQADTFFSIESDIELWENNAIEPHRFTYTRDVCYLTKKKVYQGGKLVEVDAHQRVSLSNCNRGNDAYTTEKEVYYVDGYMGTVTVPIYYDLTEFKREELDAIIDRLATSNSRCLFEYQDGKLSSSSTCNTEEAGIAVNNVLFNYYSTSLEYFNVDQFEASKYFGGSFGGVAGRDAAVTYQSGFNYLAYQGQTSKYGETVANLAWGHALYLRREGLISGSTSNPKSGCTLFAQMWLYDVYGINQSAGRGGSGHGGEFASVLVNNYPNMFEYGREPTGGGIASRRYAGSTYGHVICIDETDKANNRIVYSEGNYNGNGGVKIRIECTYEEFYRRFPNSVWTYANPKD